MVNHRMTTGEAAALAGVSDDTIARWFDAGLLSGLRLPAGGRRIDIASVRRLLADGAGTGRHTAPQEPTRLAIAVAVAEGAGGH
jgi:excisionase family DNA binding protein